MTAREKLYNFTKIYSEEKDKLQKEASSINKASEILTRAKSKWGDDIESLNDAIHQLAKLNTINILKMETPQVASTTQGME